MSPSLPPISQYTPTQAFAYSNMQHSSLAEQLTAELLDTPTPEWPPEPDADAPWPGGLWQVIMALMPRETVEEAEAQQHRCVCM